MTMFDVYEAIRQNGGTATNAEIRKIMAKKPQCSNVNSSSVAEKIHRLAKKGIVTHDRLTASSTIIAEFPERVVVSFKV